MLLECYFAQGVVLLMAYIHRTIEETLKKAAIEFPVVVLTGPRQSGKTTVQQF